MSKDQIKQRRKKILHRNHSTSVLGQSGVFTQSMFTNTDHENESKTVLLSSENTRIPTESMEAMLSIETQENLNDQMEAINRISLLNTTHWLQIKLLTDTAIIPSRQTNGSIGYDLYSDEQVTINPWTRVLISTGVSVVIPIGLYGRIASRSSLAWKYCLDVCAGVIDPDYRGEVKVLLVNMSETEYTIEKGERIAQLILEQAVVLKVEVVDKLNKTERDGGFGSTGKY